MLNHMYVHAMPVKEISPVTKHLLQPLSIPGRRWSDVTSDMIVKLPVTSRGNDPILVFVDRLSKMVHLILTKEVINAKAFAQLFFEHVVCKHGMPHVLITDRGTLVNNVFWQELCHTRLPPYVCCDSDPCFALVPSARHNSGHG